MLQAGKLTETAERDLGKLVCQVKGIEQHQRKRVTRIGQVKKGETAGNTQGQTSWVIDIKAAVLESKKARRQISN